MFISIDFQAVCLAMLEFTYSDPSFLRIAIYYIQFYVILST